jgi:hypothetical protein
VVATNALELGIDVGGLDAAVLTTFPARSPRSASRPAGRARPGGLSGGARRRRGRPRPVLHDPPRRAVQPLPGGGGGQPVEPAVAEAHAACAAYEIPLHSRTGRSWAGRSRRRPTGSSSRDCVRLKDGKLYWSHRQRPAPQCRHPLLERRTDLCDRVGRPRAAGDLDEERAFRDAHPGAVYLHQGETHVCERLDLSRREVTGTSRGRRLLHPTQDREGPRDHRPARQGPIGEVGLHHGVVRVETHVVAYQKRKLGSREVLDTVWLDLPPTVFETKGLVGDPRPPARGGRLDPVEHPGGAARRRARRDRDAAAHGHLRPLGHRGPLHQLAPPDRRGHHLHPRGLPGRRRHLTESPSPPDVTTCRRRSRPSAPAPAPRLSELRSVPQVRQLQRPARQGRGGGAARHDPLVRARLRPTQYVSHALRADYETP